MNAIKILDQASKAELRKTIKYYFFQHKTKADKEAGKNGNACETASRFYHLAHILKVKAEYYYFGEDGTGVIVEFKNETPED